MKHPHPSLFTSIFKLHTLEIQSKELASQITQQSYQLLLLRALISADLMPLGILFISLYILFVYMSLLSLFSLLIVHFLKKMGFWYVGGCVISDHLCMLYFPLSDPSLCFKKPISILLTDLP